MTSPGGTEIGRVSIRVTPDTSKFRRQLLAELREATAGVEVEIDVSVDAAGLRQELQAVTRAASAGVDAEIGVDVDQTAVQRIGDQIQAAVRNVRMPDFLGDGGGLGGVMRSVVEHAERIRASLERSVISIREATRTAGNLRSHFQGLQSGAARLGSALRGLRMPDLTRDTVSGVTAFDRFSVAVYTGLTRIGSAVRGGVTTAFTSLSRVGSQVSDAMDQAADSAQNAFRGVSGGARSALSTVGSLVGMFVQLGAVSALLSVAGAAISAAYGAVSAAVAALPSALALVAAPIGAVILGLDGIKDAAKTLEPQFGRLQAAVQRTFRDGLTPVFRELRAVFPALQAGLVGTAQSLTGVATAVARVVTSGPGLQNLRDSFWNINQSINQMAPGVTGLVSGLLQVTAQRSAFDALVGTVNTLGTEFQNSVARMTDASNGASTFDLAMKGLQGTLEAVGRLLVGLVEGGLRVFSTAAPGVNALIDSIGRFLGRFNWERLGVSVGNVFGGLADSINRVPQGTISAIEASFERIGAVFQNAEIQNAITQLINSLPFVINLIADLTQKFISLAAIGAGVAQMIYGVGQAAIGLITMDWGKIVQGTTTAMQGFDTLKAGIAAWGTDTTATVRTTVASWGTAMGEAAGQIVSGGEQWRVNAALAANQAAVALRPPGDADAPAQWYRITQDAAGKASLTPFIGPMAQSAQQAYDSLKPPPGADLSQPWAAGVAPIPGVVQQGLIDVPTVVQGTVDQLAPVVAQAFAGLESHFLVGTAQLANGVRAGGPAISIALTEVIAAAGAAVQNGFANLGGYVTSGMASVAAQVTAGMAGVSAAFSTGWDSVSTNANSAFGRIRDGVAIQVASIGTVVTSGFVAITSSFNNGWISLTVSAQAGMANVERSIRDGMGRSTTAVQDGVRAMLAALAGAEGSFRAAGSNMGAALAAGLRSRTGEVRAAAADLANAAAAATRAAAGIRSPSRVFIELGEYLGEGLAVGMQRSEPLVAAAADNLFSHLNSSRYAASVTEFDASVQHVVENDDFGIDYGRLADAIGIDGARLKLEGNDLWKVVQSQDTRRKRRG